MDLERVRSFIRCAIMEELGIRDLMYSEGSNEVCRKIDPPITVNMSSCLPTRNSGHQISTLTLVGSPQSARRALTPRSSLMPIELSYILLSLLVRRSALHRCIGQTIERSSLLCPTTSSRCSRSEDLRFKRGSLSYLGLREGVSSLWTRLVRRNR